MIQKKWEQRECRIEDGVFFPGASSERGDPAEDEYIPLRGNPEDGYEVGTRRSIRDLLDARPDGWATLYDGCEHADPEHTVFGGGGSWEGEGFVALVETGTGRLKWLLHLEGIEEVRMVERVGGEVRAVAEEYPFRRELVIPLEAPHLMTIRNTRT